MDNKDHIIELRDLFFGYTEKQWVLKNLSFSLKRGDRAALLGANGSGKTTLFHLLMGLVKPASGSVRIFGDERKTERDFLHVRRKIGLLFQDSDDQLFSPTVAEDIAFGPFNLGKSREEIKIITTKTLSALGLDGFEERITYKLSGGEKRLVALGTVLAMEPQVLLLDEPTSGLDDAHRERFLEVLQGFESYIIISHDHEFLENITDQSYTLDNGRIM
jgi:cobalt/nickel transport system ATP-binding protein